MQRNRLVARILSLINRAALSPPKASLRKMSQALVRAEQQRARGSACTIRTVTPKKKTDTCASCHLADYASCVLRFGIPTEPTECLTDYWSLHRQHNPSTLTFASKHIAPRESNKRSELFINTRAQSQSSLGRAISSQIPISI